MIHLSRKKKVHPQLLVFHYCVPPTFPQNTHHLHLVPSAEPPRLDVWITSVVSCGNKCEETFPWKLKHQRHKSSWFVCWCSMFWRKNKNICPRLLRNMRSTTEEYKPSWSPSSFRRKSYKLSLGIFWSCDQDGSLISDISNDKKTCFTSQDCLAVKEDLQVQTNLMHLCF